MRTRHVAAAFAAALFAGCSGGGSGPVSSGNSGSNSGPGSSSSAQANAVSAISDTNALGSPLENFSEFDKAAGSSLQGAQSAAKARDAATGVCRNGVEFYAPDTNGDANSTETIAFYDAACTSEARDTVRIFSSTGSTSETVNVAERSFAAGNATPIATRSGTHTISNATFNQYGYPVASDGFDLVATDALTINTAKSIDSSREYVLEQAAGQSNAFCSDAAGFNAVADTSTGDTFGWAGGVGNGTRTINGDGSVTWTATHVGTSYTGAVGALSIATGTQNTTCPIATPDFSLAGGTVNGTYSVPVVATFAHGVLESLSLTGATLANGDTLSVMTNTGQGPSSADFITGSIGKNGTQLATFAVDAFGDGTLTVTATGKQYVITSWHVVT